MTPFEPQPPPPVTSPYKFLDYFEEKEKDRFAGREKESQEIAVGITRGPLYVIYGRSGLGKTSLLLAGVFPLLRERGLHPLRIRVLDSPVEDLCQALAEALEHPELREHQELATCLERVPRVLQEVSEQKPLVLVLDQFEEFFVRFRKKPRQRADFASLLGRIHRQSNVRLVFCLREDYYAELEDLNAELPQVTANGFRLLPLSTYGTRQAIVRPLLAEGIEYEESLVNALVDQMQWWDFEPTTLQIACTELYQEVLARRNHPVILKREDLEGLGGVDGIYRQYVRGLGKELTHKQQFLIWLTLDALIASEKIKQASRLTDLLGKVRARPEELSWALERLVGRRLVRAERRHGESWYELMHDRLVDIIQTWQAEDKEYANFRFAKSFVQVLSEGTGWRTDPSGLLSRTQLTSLVEPWKEQLPLNEREREFLLRSSILGQTATVAYWAGRLDESGPGRSVALMRELLDHPSPEMQLGAAASCRQLSDETGLLAERCLKLALESPDEHVRRAAGSSFARLARPEQLEALRQEREHRPLRGPTLALMADLAEVERLPRDFSWRQRHRIQALVRERHMRRAPALIKQRTRSGIFASLLAAVAWSLTVGLSMLVLLFMLYSPEALTSGELLEFFGLVLGRLLGLMLALLALGALVGWRVARWAAIYASLPRGEAWRRATLRGAWPVLLAPLVLAPLVLAPLMLALPSRIPVPVPIGGDPRALSVVLGVAGLASWVSMAGVVRLGWRCTARGQGEVFIYAWALLCSLMPLLGATFVWMGVAELWPDASSWLIVQSWLFWFALFTSALGFISFCAIARGWFHSGAAAASAYTNPQWPRRFVALGLPAFVGLLLLKLGPDSVPWMARRYQIETSCPSPQGCPPVTFEGEVSQHWVDSDYIRLEPSKAGLFALSLRSIVSRGCELTLGGDYYGGYYASREDLLVVSRGNSLLASVSNAFPEGCTRYEYAVREQPILEDDLGEMQPGEWTLAKLQFTPEEQGQVSLGGRLTQDAFERRRPFAQLVLLRIVPLLFPKLPESPLSCLVLEPASGDAEESRLRKELGTLEQEFAERIPLPPRKETVSLRPWEGEGVLGRLNEDGSWSLELTLRRSESGCERSGALPFRAEQKGSRGVLDEPQTLGPPHEPISLVVAVRVEPLPGFDPPPDESVGGSGPEP